MSHGPGLLRLMTIGALVASLLTLSACAGAPRRVAPIPTIPVSLDTAAREAYPQLRSVEECGENARVLEFLAEIASTPAPTSAVQSYVRARTLLAAVVNTRFDLDHGVWPSSSGAAWQQMRPWIDQALAELEPYIEGGAGESEHYRLRADLITMAIRFDFWRIESARSSLTEAARIDPDNPWVDVSWAKQFVFAPLGMRDIDLARTHLQRAIKLDPTWSEPYIYLARAARLEEKFGESQRHLERCAELNPDRRFVRVLLSHLPEDSPLPRD